VSQLAEEFSSDDVIIIGVNNESIFGMTKPPNMDVLLPFLEEHEEEFQYTIVVDNAEGFAKDGTYFGHLLFLFFFVFFFLYAQYTTGRSQSTTKAQPQTPMASD